MDSFTGAFLRKTTQEFMVKIISDIKLPGEVDSQHWQQSWMRGRLSDEPSRHRVQEWSQDCKLSCDTTKQEHPLGVRARVLYLWGELVMVLKEEQGIISSFFHN